MRDRLWGVCYQDDQAADKGNCGVHLQAGGDRRWHGNR